MALVSATPPPPGLPSSVIDRARRYRARLGPDDAELSSAGEVSAEPLTLLAVGVLDGGQREIEAELASLRATIAPGGQLWLVERTRRIRPESAVLRGVRGLRRRRQRGAEITRDVVGALRSTGWTIGSIERFVADEVDGRTTQWVDVVAFDLDGERAGSPEG